MNKTKKVFAVVMAIALMLSVFAGCDGDKPSSSTASGAGSTESGAASSSQESKTSTAQNATETDLSKEVNLVYYLWGTEGVANPDVLSKINEKLKADLNCTLEIKYIDWGDIGTKYPLLFASGESFDLSHAGSGATPSVYTLAKQETVIDITDMLDLVPTLRDEIPEKTWNGAKVDGKIIAVPCLYSEFTPNGYAYRNDFVEKYKVKPITSLETMEAYMKAVKDGGEMMPLNLNATESTGLYHMMVDLTKDWIPAPGLGQDTNYLVAESVEKYKEIIHPAFTDEFVDWCKKMKEWGDAGYWSKDVLASEIGAGDNARNGQSAGFIAHMPAWTGNYGAFEKALPGVEIDWWSPAVDNGKIFNKPGIDNCTVISTTSEHPERALMALEKFITDESYYRLFQYGIEGRQYEIADGLAVEPAKYDKDADFAGFAVWSLRNDRLNIPYKTEDPRRYELIEEWKTVAIDSPFSGFTFDPENVSNEIASILNVNASEGRQLMFGKVEDVDAAVKSYRAALQTAGVDRVIEELKTQLESWTPLS